MKSQKKLLRCLQFSALALGLFNCLSALACDPRVVAPVKLDTPKAWATDSGPLLHAFADLKLGEGIYSVEHGFDLSHHNVSSVSYDEVKRCGATFAIVKMDEEFKTHAKELARRKVITIPYYYLGAFGPEKVNYKTNPQIFSKADGKPLSREELNVLLQLARTLGESAAMGFISKYEAALSPEQRKVSLSGLAGQVVALDVEEAFTVKSTETQRVSYGRFYAALLGSWVKTVTAKHSEVIVLFYTFPDMFISYLNNALPEDNKIIHGMPLWLANPRDSADDVDYSKKVIQRLCGSAAGGNRCIVHQYTQRGLFGVRPSKGKGVPNHLDVNRFFKVKEIQDGSGKQYVREQMPPPAPRK